MYILQYKLLTWQILFIFLVLQSFYLPRSAVANGKQIEDWPVNTPPIYLWSRAEWTAWRIPIAREHGHVSKEQDDYLSGDKYVCDGFPNPLGVPRGDCRRLGNQSTCHW